MQSLCVWLEQAQVPQEPAFGANGAVDGVRPDREAEAGTVGSRATAAEEIAAQQMDPMARYVVLFLFVKPHVRVL